jgi:Bacteriophage translational regulator
MISSTNELVNTFIEVTFDEEEDFLKIRETLSRIGVASKQDKKLFQSCHILHKQGKYYIVHFKELFALDGKVTDFTQEDKARRNTIIKLLEDWNLLQVVDDKKILDPITTLSHIKILSHKEKNDWQLCTKYTLGKIKKRG